MGGENSSEADKTFEDMREEYEVYQKITDDRLGEVVVLKHRLTGETFGMTELAMGSQEEVEEFKGKFEEKK